jgi:hypothetical protein
VARYKPVRGSTKKQRVELANSKTAEALIVFMDAGLMPLEDFKGVNSKWESKCMKCGAIVSPRFADIQGGGGGCKPCSLIPSEEKVNEAIEIMRKSNLEPIKPFANSSSPWECKCMKCGEIVTPSLQNIKKGHGGCVYCQVAAFKHNEPAYLYLVHHELYGAYKVGIGNFKTVNDRIESHKKSGWSLLEKYSFEKGSQAFKIEKKILHWVRKELELPIHLTNKDFTHGGASETFSDGSVTALEIKKKIEETIKGLQK